MKFNQYTWDLYKQSSGGQKAIKEFEEARESILEYDLTCKYNPYLTNLLDKEQFADTCGTLWYYAFQNMTPPENLEDAKDFYVALITLGILDEHKEFIVEKGDYRLMLSINNALSFLLYYFAPEYYFPNLFVCRFFDFNKTADTFDIDLPSIPKKSDYQARCMYYWELCKVLYQFRTENELTPAELCAFLYDFSPNFIPKGKTEIPKPAQAWFIGGKTDPVEAKLDVTFWQANKETKKGDILVHYETSPVSALSCLWIAQTDGVIDPFFHYYSNTYIGNKIEIPHITLRELQADEYFSKHPLVRKKFQGVNGWTLSSEDYSRLLEMISAKGFNVNLLPHLYAPQIAKDDILIVNERSVETELLEPLLNSMGWYENKDFIRQLPIHAGRGHRIFPDYALHYDNKPDYERAKVLIEAKLYMKNNQEIEETFKQARSYANILESSVVILCDKNCLLVYEKKDSFNRYSYTKYYWEDMETPDKFNELKNKLDI